MQSGRKLSQLPEIFKKDCKSALLSNIPVATNEKRMYIISVERTRSAKALLALCLEGYG
jgi:hypothetical protein